MWTSRSTSTSPCQSLTLSRLQRWRVMMMMIIMLMIIIMMMMVISLIRLKAHNYNPRWTTLTLWSIGSSLNGNCHEEIIFRIRKIFNWSSVKFPYFTFWSQVRLPDQVFQPEVKPLSKFSRSPRCSEALDSIPRLWQHREERGNPCMWPLDHPHHLTTMTHPIHS